MSDTQPGSPWRVAVPVTVVVALLVGVGSCGPGLWWDSDEPTQTVGHSPWATPTPGGTQPTATIPTQGTAPGAQDGLADGDRAAGAPNGLTDDEGRTDATDGLDDGSSGAIQGLTSGVGSSGATHSPTVSAGNTAGATTGSAPSSGGAAAGNTPSAPTSSSAGLGANASSGARPSTSSGTMTTTPDPPPGNADVAVELPERDPVSATVFADLQDATASAQEQLAAEQEALNAEQARLAAEKAEAEALVDVDAFLDLTINQVDHGTILAHVERDDVLILEETLDQIGIELRGLKTVTLPSGQFVRLSGFGTDLSYDVNPSTLQLDVMVDPALLPVQKLDMRAQLEPADMERVNDVSAFLNYGVRTVSFQSVDGFSEFGMNVKAARLYSGVTFPWQAVPVRGLSNITYDHVASKHRFTAGDAFARSDNLGGSAFIGGLQVAKTYELDPYFVPGPTLDQQTQVMLPSTMEVYVNGRLTDRTEVQPGPLDISNLPITSGAGDTRVVLRDALGREQTITASYYLPRGMLAGGQQEYSYTLGFQRFGLGVESFDYRNFAAMGAHRIGVNQWLTTGVRAEATTDRFSGGASATTASAIGQVEVAGGYSTIGGQHGGAASLNWSYMGRRIGASAYGRYMSDQYTTLTVDPEFDRATAQAGSNISVPITQRFTVSGGYGLNLMRDTGMTHRTTLNAGVQLPRNIQLGAFGLWSRRAAGEDEYLVNLSVVANFGPRITAQVRGEFASQGNNASAELSMPRPVNNGLGFRVGGRAGTNNQAYAYTTAQSPWFRTDASVQWTPENTSGTLGLSGGLVGIGGKVFATRPVESSYALVRVPGVKGVRAYLNNNAVARTNRKGDAIVLGLLPYYGNRLSIADLDVPLDHAIGDEERVIAPAVRSGAVVAFPVSVLRLIRGTVMVNGQEAQYGSMVVHAGDTKVFSPIGKAGAFELQGVPPGVWMATAEVEAGTCTMALTVAEDGKTITNVGQQDCTLATAEAP